MHAWRRGLHKAACSCLQLQGCRVAPSLRWKRALDARLLFLLLQLLRSLVAPQHWGICLTVLPSDSTTAAQWVPLVCLRQLLTRHAGGLPHPQSPAARALPLPCRWEAAVCPHGSGTPERRGGARVRFSTGTATCQRAAQGPHSNCCCTAHVYHVLQKPSPVLLQQLGFCIVSSLHVFSSSRAVVAHPAITARQLLLLPCDETCFSQSSCKQRELKALSRMGAEQSCFSLETGWPYCLVAVRRTTTTWNPAKHLLGRGFAGSCQGFIQNVYHRSLPFIKRDRPATRALELHTLLPVSLHTSQPPSNLDGAARHQPAHAHRDATLPACPAGGGYKLCPNNVI